MGMGSYLIFIIWIVWLDPLSVAVKCLTINLQIHLGNLGKFKLTLENKLRLD